MKRRDAVHLGCVVHVPCPGPYNSTYGRDESVPLFHFRTFMILWKGSFHVRRVLVETAPTCCTRALSTWRGSGGPVGYSSPRRGSRYDRRSWTFVSSWFFFYSLSFWFVKKKPTARPKHLSFVLFRSRQDCDIASRATCLAGWFQRGVFESWVVLSLFVSCETPDWAPASRNICETRLVAVTAIRVFKHLLKVPLTASLFFLFFGWTIHRDAPAGAAFSYLLLFSAKNGSVCWLPPYLIYTRHQLLFMTRFIHNLSPVWTRIRFLKFL